MVVAAHHAAVLTEKQKKLLLMVVVVALALILPTTLAVVGIRQMWRESPRAPQLTPEHTAALREAAERAADAALPVPTLAADAIVVECAPEALEAQVQRVVRLSGGVGGAASSWNDGVTIRIIAKIPADAESVFRDAVTRGFYDLKIAQGSEKTTVVEVLLKPQAKTTTKEKKKP